MDGGSVGTAMEVLGTLILVMGSGQRHGMPSAGIGSSEEQQQQQQQKNKDGRTRKKYDYFFIFYFFFAC
jgi:hypothetical protein